MGVWEKENDYHLEKFNSIAKFSFRKRSVLLCKTILILINASVIETHVSNTFDRMMNKLRGLIYIYIYICDITACWILVFAASFNVQVIRRFDTFSEHGDES
jgi:hypothetical protein